MPDERKQGLVDLLTRIGDDKIELENLDHRMTNIRSSGRGGASVTFLTHGTTPGDVACDNGRLGLVLWLDRADVEAAREAFKAEVPGA